MCHFDVSCKCTSRERRQTKCSHRPERQGWKPAKPLPRGQPAVPLRHQPLTGVATVDSAGKLGILFEGRVATALGFPKCVLRVAGTPGFLLRLQGSGLEQRDAGRNSRGPVQKLPRPEWLQRKRQKIPNNGDSVEQNCDLVYCPWEIKCCKPLGKSLGSVHTA